MRIKFYERTVNQSQKVNHTKRYKSQLTNSIKLL